MKIHVMSYGEASANKNNIKTANAPIISILGSYKTQEAIFKDYENALTIIFDDIEKEMTYDGEKLTLFNEGHAEQILDFIEKHKNSDIFYVHCYAGISRSGAIGRFMCEKLNEKNPEDRQWFADHVEFRIMPNTHILKVLNRVYCNREEK